MTSGTRRRGPSGRACSPRSSRRSGIFTSIRRRRGQDGRGPDLPAVTGLARTIRECAIPMQPLIDLIRANQQDQVVSRYQAIR